MTSIMNPPSGTPSNDAKFSASAAQPPKKKRKRTGTGGASDDCFTCTSRSVKCDRKRPYCTQCLEIGKECSGYKTTLTWGVGVASRGKLRGLSCPIAQKDGDERTTNSAEGEGKKQRRKASVSQNDKKETETKSPPKPAQNESAMITGIFNQDFGFPQAYQPANTPIQQTPLGWEGQSYAENIFARRAEGVRDQGLNMAPLQPIQTHLDHALEAQHGPKSGRSMSSYSDAAFYSPLEYPRTPSSLPYPEALGHPGFADHAAVVGSLDGSSISGSSVDSYQDFARSRLNSNHLETGLSSNDTITTTATYTRFPDVFYSSTDGILTPMSNHTSGVGPNPEIFLDDDDLAEDSKDLALFDTRFTSAFFQMTPRLQSLMEYYDRNICTYLVAFDGPDNPYRKHILQLAFRNEGLQHAIAALATNNYRMRTKELRQTGHVHELNGTFSGDIDDMPSGPSAEETMYKQMSIDHLNMQLADAGAAQDDSVLATLLILCLFHVCDSGFSKFKTQLAGVQKLLSLRHPHSQSDFTRWVEMFFSWFDVMTSTVNDREVQIKSDSSSMLDFNVNLGAMEQFSGCDGRLFKIIACLGRLNLLAQGRPVRKLSDGRQPTPRPFPRPNLFWRKPTSAPMPSLIPSDYENIDGNGWGTPIISSDDDAEGSPSTPDDRDFLPIPDPRRTFWAEWNDTRARLEAWQMSLPGSGAEHTDLYHINESFRVAALLYTERLGHPLLPSSADAFQLLVARALTHITALQVTSCVNKFLLWPLFIIGTECVNEDHRDIVRTRCRDVAEESGFYNNMSSLYVLERVWGEVGSNVRGMEAEEVQARRRDSEASRPGRFGQAFRWRKAMDRVDGEYIVI